MIKAVDLRSLTADELTIKHTELKKELFNLRMQHATNQLDNPIRLREIRKDIARVQTVIRQNELGEVSGQ